MCLFAFVDLVSRTFLRASVSIIHSLSHIINSPFLWGSSYQPKNMLFFLKERKPSLAPHYTSSLFLYFFSLLFRVELLKCVHFLSSYSSSTLDILSSHPLMESFRVINTTMLLNLVIISLSLHYSSPQ